MDEPTKSSSTLQNLQELSAILKQRTQFLREENARMEAIFKKLKLLNEDMKIPGIEGPSNKLIEAMEPDILSTNTNSLKLSCSDRLRKHNNYVSKLKICIKLYLNLNDKISKEIKSTKWELDQGRSTIDSVLSLSTKELKQWEEKTKRYENELIKFEKKYPWLKNPEFNLPNISKEITTLESLREEKVELLKELSIYQGLKPDLKEASQQLANIKLENQEISNKLLKEREH